MIRISTSALLTAAALSIGLAAGAAEPDCVPIRGLQRPVLESRCEHLAVAGRTRTYRLYVPARRHGPAPLVLVLHGGGGSGANMEELTLEQFNRLADRNGFIVAYPDGVGRGWNDGRSDLKAEAVKEGVDDVGFLRVLVEKLGRAYDVDRQRVFATGLSNGGLMSYRLACDAADLFAAVAPVAANMSVELAPKCRPASPVSVLIIDGKDDPIMPWAGGEIKVLWTRRGAVLPAQASFERWVELDGCAKPTIDAPVDRIADDGTSLVRHAARHCRGTTEVLLYEVDGGGHTWPSGEPYLGERIVGKVSRELNASEEIWNFFARHPRR
jgi:polyhydroxybutyrate depolymerase